MKILVTVLIFFSASVLVSAQMADSISPVYEGCFEDFKTLFAERGVYELKDGLHNTVITIRLNGVCNMYKGTARIEAGKFVLPLYIEDDNGKFVTLKSTGRKLNMNYDAYKIPLENKVVNGCSPTYISDRDELVDIFIIDLLKPAITH